MKVHFTFAGIVFSAISIAMATGSFSKTFAAQNRAGLPSGLILETTDLGKSEQVEKLLVQLENREFQNSVKEAALKQSVDTSRALNEDWEDPGLCQHDWLNWLPWLNCVLETPERAAPPIFFQEEGECYREL